MAAGHVICLTPPVPPPSIAKLLALRQASQRRQLPAHFPPAATRATAPERRAADRDCAGDSSSGSEPWDQESQESEGWESPSATRSTSARVSLTKPVVSTIILLNLAVISGVVYCGLADMATSRRPADVRTAPEASRDGGARILLTSGEIWQRQKPAVASVGPQRFLGMANRGRPSGHAARSEGQTEGAPWSSVTGVATEERSAGRTRHPGASVGVDASSFGSKWENVASLPSTASPSERHSVEAIERQSDAGAAPH